MINSKWGGALDIFHGRHCLVPVSLEVMRYPDRSRYVCLLIFGLRIARWRR